MVRAPKPYIYSRAQWGANEKMREQSAAARTAPCRPASSHHTVNANNYTAAQVPALLRGIYAYHTQSRGWRDIGYNYLVDRFGRIWEGRYGGVDRAVVGAHTLGYNEVSFAMSAIGNFDIAQPAAGRARRLRAAVRLEAVALQHPGQPDATSWSRAATAARSTVTETSGRPPVPGRYLYAQLPYIRHEGACHPGRGPERR